MKKVCSVRLHDWFFEGKIPFAVTTARNIAFFAELFGDLKDWRMQVTLLLSKNNPSSGCLVSSTRTTHARTSKCLSFFIILCCVMRGSRVLWKLYESVITLSLSLLFLFLSFPVLSWILYFICASHNNCAEVMFLAIYSFHFLKNLTALEFGFCGCNIGNYNAALHE